MLLEPVAKRVFYSVMYESNHICLKALNAFIFYFLAHKLSYLIINASMSSCPDDQGNIIWVLID